MATSPAFSPLVQNIASSLKVPVEQLRLFYQKALERKLSLRQTALLINAQAAFFFAFMPVESPLLLRLASLAWLALALLKCKREL